MKSRDEIHTWWRQHRGELALMIVAVLIGSLILLAAFGLL